MIQNRAEANLNGVWEVPDNLDTSEFDFDWRPDIYDRPYIHQFGTQWQKTGGPRYVVAGASEIKYVNDQRAIALPNREHWNIIYPINEEKFDFSWHPDAHEVNYKYVFGNNFFKAEAMPTVIYNDKQDATTKYVYTQRAILTCKPLDIVFMSNGEIDEEKRYNALCAAAKRQVKWVRGVSGRENAIRQAATISETDWVIVFPGKLLVNPKFNFDFQPNYSLESKHYIFYATNPVNGLEYGHMAAVAYNKQLVLDTHEYGLDFTMSKPHDIVKINCGIAQYNLDPVMTWRTAFREVIKLQVACASGDKESADRLHIWLTIGNGLNGEYSVLGAKHGLEYYHEVRGDPAALQLSFDWDWLDKKYMEKFNV